MPIHLFEEQAFRGLTSLHKLNMRRCEISEMPPLNPVKRTLISVRLSHNRIKSIPGEYFIGFLKLSTLDLSFNLLQSISQLHPLSDTLEQLYLDSNKLEDFPSNVHNITYTVLVILHLPQNYLSAFRKTMLKSFPSLRTLHLSITRMPIHLFEEQAFRGLTSLHKLNMRRCEISEMPPLIPVKRTLISVRLCAQENYVKNLSLVFVHCIWWKTLFHT